MVHMERDDNVKDVIVRNPEANVGRYHLRDFAYSKTLLAFFALPGFLAAGEGVGDRCMILTTNKLALEHPHKPETGRFPVRRVIQQSTPLALRDRVDVIDTVRDLPNPPTGSTDVLTDSEPGSINVGSPNGPRSWSSDLNIGSMTERRRTDTLPGPLAPFVAATRRCVRV
eukprot:CAMPEP_0182532216 /NCGR_PEP_ID=MMETSP1323-20130603/11016_1 /TAXON_ID=236787 /ORGANISM="Florenciella parvula, Strain RCC1693" /LENGTH=169 /DNA_ID=CAMNT_0024741919 /DNA_START=360 /DNA_END=866 /DNA_ORIENTATION=+